MYNIISDFSMFFKAFYKFLYNMVINIHKAYNYTFILLCVMFENKKYGVLPKREYAAFFIRYSFLIRITATVMSSHGLG